MLKGLVGALESRLVFFPYRGEDENPRALGITYRALTLTTSDGERIAAWQLEPEAPVADVVYFHGNGGNLSVWLPVLASLHALRLRVLAIDYRGYGLSTGSPSEDGVYRDAEAAVRYAAANRRAGPLIPIAASATRIIVPDGLILESTFVDKAAVIRRQPLLRALNMFATYRFPTVEMLEHFSRPVLVIHGDRDTVIPYPLGEELYRHLGGSKHFAHVSGADHNDLFDISREEYWKPVFSFVSSLRSR
jgi:pimeloyl-ACP methyl ester carboxylesterase